MESRSSRCDMEIIRELKRGAESIIYEGYFAGIHAIFKKRISKSYRDQKLDYKINSERTKLEARLMYSALKNGINVPALLLVDPYEYLIVMEYIDGFPVKEIVPKYKDDNLIRIGEMIGEIAGKLHKSGISHGDFTTNNLIYTTDNEIFLIDFGLSKRSDDIEDFATDVHVFLRSLESVHYEFKDIIFKGFEKGYSKFMDFKSIMNTVKQIRMRGRYVEERRSKRNNV
ncbi:Kae1-associated kinase Bud32 [Sulfurisphaera ohwakuensis]|uniref:non-specific serine/threonine protein kinase n=2 Tax=Sulfurisphaera ohwakuensis TaxID=69656 RepID=A0A650CDT9_SULOH|nr:Kae1-associated kinase Bud32 [Sulfurisphaera ohwakuensis]QGR16011.1 Kae1-associated kinase Bud32 [Sulfurisphaera ohwakuensis]